MFRPINNNVSAPVTTAMFIAPAAGQNITSYCETFRANDPNTIATIGSMIIAVAAAASHADDTPLRNNARKAFRGDSYIAVYNLANALVPDPTDDNSHNINAIVANGPACINWLADLINAAKKKPLTDDNVEGYFASLGHTGSRMSAIATFINQIQAYFPDDIGNAEFRSLLMPGIWTTYRNTRVSTGLILRDLLPDFRALRITIADDAVEAAIIACANAPWDINLSLAIPNKFKAYACILREVAGNPIDKWYQGNSAVDELPASKVRGIRNIFRRYLDVKNNINVDTHTTVADFTASDAVRDFF